VTVRVVPAADRIIVVISSSGDVDRHIIMISSYASVARNGWRQTTKFILTVNRMVDKCSQTLFVFYTRPKTYWKYAQFPDGWAWIGSGRTDPIGTKETHFYTHEEQFEGPIKSKPDMIAILEQTFGDLQKLKVTESYKITETYNDGISLSLL